MVRTLSSIAVVVALTAPFAVPSFGGEPTSNAPADIVGRLLDIQPWLAEFEKVVGPVDRDRTKWEEAIGPLHRNRADGPVAHLDLDFSIDIYHQDPREEENVELSSWNILFRGDSNPATARLRQRFGEGVALDFAPGRPRRFGDYYLTVLPEGFELSWFAHEPEWAVPVRDAARDRALVDRVLAFLRSGVRDQTIEAAFGKLEPQPRTSLLAAIGDDWRVEVSHDKAERPAWVSIEFRGKPVDATRLIESLGLREPGMIATDVHLSGRRLVDLATEKEPVVDGYRLSVGLDPELLESIPAQRPGAASWRPRSWTIRSVWLSR